MVLLHYERSLCYLYEVDHFHRPGGRHRESLRIDARLVFIYLFIFLNNNSRNV